jgi:hypothetical protein
MGSLTRSNGKCPVTGKGVGYSGAAGAVSLEDHFENV